MKIIILFATFLAINVESIGQVNESLFKAKNYEPIKPTVSKPLDLSNHTEWVHKEQERKRAEEQAKKIEEQKKIEHNITQVKSLYSTIKKSINIPNGMYVVFVTNNYDFGDYRNVYVLNNKISQYFKNENEEIEIQFSSTIDYGKASIKLNENIDILDLYFLDNLINSK